MKTLLIDTPLTRAALEIATNAHAGQTRHGGEPYITHPIAVANRAAGIYVDLKSPFLAPAILKRRGELTTVTGLYHDILEDTPVTEDSLFVSLMDSGLLTGEETREISQALDSLTKKPNATYLSAVLAASRHWLSTTVKLADLWHNLPTAKPHNREKYLLAQYILEHL